MRPEAACCVAHTSSLHQSAFYSFECADNSQGMGICFQWNSVVGMEGFWSGVHVCLSVREASKGKQAKGLEPQSIVELECPLLPRTRRCMQEWLSLPALRVQENLQSTLFQTRCPQLITEHLVLLNCGGFGSFKEFPS